jgi:hypothetical protein
MVFVPTPEATARISFVESRVRLEHLLTAVGFKHSFRSLNGVLFRDVHWEVNVTSAKAEITELKPEAFEIPERLGASVDMRLLLEAVVVAFGFKHHSHPVVSGVNRWFFMATAIYTIHIF